MTTPQDSAREELRNLLESLSDDLFMLDSEQCHLLADKITKAIIFSHQRGFKEGVEASAIAAKKFLSPFVGFTMVEDGPDVVCEAIRSQLNVAP